MRLVLGTVSSNSDFNGGCDFAVVTISPQYARQILCRMKALMGLAQSDDSLHEAHYWDFAAQYFEFPADEDLQEKLEAAHDTHVELDEACELPEDLFQRTEYAHMVVEVMGDQADVSWRASPKNASVYVETNPVAQSLIEKVAGDGGEV
jgi:hypothetical protein